MRLKIVRACVRVFFPPDTNIIIIIIFNAFIGQY